MGQVSNYFSESVARVGTIWREELAAILLSPLRDNEHFLGHMIVLRQVPRKINADSGLACLFFHAPPPVTGMAPEGIVGRLHGAIL